MFVLLHPFVWVSSTWIPASLRLCVFISYFYPLKSVEMTVAATEHDLSLKYILVSDELLCYGFCKWCTWKLPMWLGHSWVRTCGCTGVLTHVCACTHSLVVLGQYMCAVSTWCATRQWAVCVLQAGGFEFWWLEKLLALSVPWSYTWGFHLYVFHGSLLGFQHSLFYLEVWPDLVNFLIFYLLFVLILLLDFHGSVFQTWSNVKLSVIWELDPYFVSFTCAVKSRTQITQPFFFLCF